MHDIEQMTTLSDRYRRATWIVLAVCLFSCLLTLNYNGPFFDEGIYVTAGIRTLEGTAYEDNFLSWFGGSLAWPVLAGLGFRVGGLIGTRAVAVVLTVGGLAAFARAVSNLFGEKVSFWATLALALNGPFLALARLGVYDALALSGVAVAFWTITELEKRDHRVWLVASAGVFTLAVFAKYPVGIMVAPILGTVLFLREEKATTDILLFAFLAGALGLAFFLPVREQVGEFFNWRLENRPSFGVSLRTIAFVIGYLSVVPFVLALAGWFIARKKRWMASVMLLSMTIWPAYHLLAGDPTSTNKHLVFGYLFAYPLVGLTVSTIWGNASTNLTRKALAVLVILVLAGLGLLQVNQSDHSWPDVRPTAAYLVNQVEPGEELLINESWPFTMYLYTAGRIDSPWDVYDYYRVTHEESPPVCEVDWFVDSRGSFAWPEDVIERVEQCGTFEEVFSDTSQVINLGADLQYVSYPVKVVVWKNTSE